MITYVQSGILLVEVKPARKLHWITLLVRHVIMHIGTRALKLLLFQKALCTPIGTGLPCTKQLRQPLINRRFRGLRLLSSLLLCELLIDASQLSSSSLVGGYLCCKGYVAICASVESLDSAVLLFTLNMVGETEIILIQTSHRLRGVVVSGSHPHNCPHIVA
jgi:hypothetical protein